MGTLETRALLSANAIPITKDSRLRLQVSNVDTAAHTVNIRTLFVTDDGQIHESFDTLLCNAGAIGTAINIGLTKGFLISVTVGTVEASVDRGLLYAVINLVRGAVIDASSVLMLTSGYVTSGKSVNYPLSPFEDSLTGIGQSFRLAGAVMGAGNDTRFTFPAFEQSEFCFGQITFTTSAAVAVRTVNWNYNDLAGNTFYNVTPRTTQAASLVRDYIFWTGPNMPLDTGSQIYVPIPNTLIQRNSRLQSNVTNIQVADDFSAGNVWRKPLIIL